MSLRIGGIAVTVALLIASGAVAQQTPPTSPPVFTPRPSFTPPLDRRLVPGTIQSEIFRENLSRQAAGATPERRSRSARVAALVDQGACGEAEALARRERDTLMADRVVEVCVPGVGLSTNER